MLLLPSLDSSFRTHKPFYPGLIDPRGSNVITGQVGPGSPSAFTYWIEPSGLYIIYCSRVGALMGNSQNWIYNSANDEFQAAVLQLMSPCLFLILTLFTRTCNPAQRRCLLACWAPCGCRASAQLRIAGLLIDRAIRGTSLTPNSVNHV